MLKIVKLCLESRTLELHRQEKSLREIGDILTTESGKLITKDAVSSFLETCENLESESVTRHAQLQNAVLEAKISTIEDRQYFIHEMKKIVETSEDEKIKIMAALEGSKMLDGLSKILGEMSPENNGMINNFNMLNLSDIPTDHLLRMATNVSST